MLKHSRGRLHPGLCHMGMAMRGALPTTRSARRGTRACGARKDLFFTFPGAYPFSARSAPRAALRFALRARSGLKPRPTKTVVAPPALGLSARIAASSMLRHSSLAAEPKSVRAFAISLLRGTSNKRSFGPTRKLKKTLGSFTDLRMTNFSRGHPFDSPLARSGQVTEHRMVSIRIGNFGAENSCFRGLFVL